MFLHGRGEPRGRLPRAALGQGQMGSENLGPRSRKWSERDKWGRH